MLDTLSTNHGSALKLQASTPAFWTVVLLSSLVLLPLQGFTVGIAQLSQIWALLAIALLVRRGEIHASLTEILIYFWFLGYALVVTIFAGYPHIKAVEQLIKFGFLYPVFYLIGRAAGDHYLKRELPYTYLMLWLFLGFQYAIQYFQVPFLYHKVDFMRDALYGTFKERNWLAIYFFLTSYLLFLQSARRPRDALNFIAFGVAVALLSQSKTILIPVGMVMLFLIHGRWGLKTLLLFVGGLLYVWRFGSALSGGQLQERLQDERGLAFAQSMKLLGENYFGYGFGFVEAHFSALWIHVQGLGSGTNSVFSSPLDLMLIAGIPGLVFWVVFFCGVGLRSTILLIPIASWSLINPIHQSGLVYLFMGILVTFGMQGLTFKSGLNIETNG